METKFDPTGEWPGTLPEYFFSVPPKPGLEIAVIEEGIPLDPHY